MGNFNGKCDCGKRIGKHMHKCRKCADAVTEARYAENRKIVATKHCPECNRLLQRNYALAGWYQCTGFSTGACNFQCFTS